jgi:hypothetical protein
MGDLEESENGTMTRTLTCKYAVFIKECNVGYFQTITWNKLEYIKIIKNITM